jgi:hypothetical protein
MRDMPKCKTPGRPKKELPMIRINRMIEQGASHRAISVILHIPYTSLLRALKPPQKRAAGPSIATLKFRQRKVQCIIAKGGKCQNCGIEYNGTNACIFDFHHTDPSKKHRGNDSTLMSATEEEMKRELEKCILLCSNCHRLEHSGEKNDRHPGNQD